jgi:hypothetical protein
LLFFVTQVNVDLLLIDFTIIVFGLVAFVYFFVLPGLPWILTSNPFGVSLNPRVLLFILMYASVGNYIGLLIGMLVGLPIIGLICPLFLVLASILFSLFRNIQSLPKEPSIKLEMKKPEFVFLRNSIVLVGIVVFLSSLAIRFIMFNTNVVEYSDVLDYHQQIEAIASNDFLSNSYFASRAPLYAMFAYLFEFFIPTPLASLKIVSFMFGFLLLIPAYSIIQSLLVKRGTSNAKVLTLSLLLIYPWTMTMASVGLQDILLTFYVMSFVALILRTDDVDILAAAGAGALAFLSRYSLGILGPIGFIYLIVRDRREGLLRSISFGFIWSIIAGSWIVRNVLVAGVPFSTVDEGLFNLDQFIPGLINIAKFIAMDRHGMNTLALWIPIAIGFLMLLRSETGRQKIRQFFTLDYLFIYLIIIGQVITIATFRSQQYRFLLSAIWLIPIVYIICLERFEIPGKRLLVAGWVLFSLSHVFNLNRVYWVFDQGRLPLGRYPGPSSLISSVFPSVSNGLILSVAILVSVILFIAMRTILQSDQRN